MSKQSERQWGAFFILQLLENKPIKWEEKQVTFRNRVIHQGYIPKSDEAIDYGQFILSFIFTGLKELQENSSEFLQKALVIHLTKNGDKVPEGVSVSNASMPTIIGLRSIKSTDFGNITLKDALRSVKENSFYRHFYRKSM